MNKEEKQFYKKYPLTWLCFSIIFVVILLAAVINLNGLKDNLIKDKYLKKSIKTELTDKGYTKEITKSNLEKIERLFIAPDKNLLNLEGIENLENLESLYVLGAKDIRGIDRLDHLPKLKNLDLSFIDLDELLKAEKFPSLRELDIHISNYQSNMYFKGENYPNLKGLDLQNIKLTDLSLIKELKTIESLRLGRCEIDSLDGIEYLTSLKELEISDSKIKNADKLKELPNLKVSND